MHRSIGNESGQKRVILKSLMKIKVILLVFCTMGFTLLLVVGLMERNVVVLLINESSNVSEENIRLTFSALQRIVGVLPYTLGVIIAGTFVLSIVQIIKSKLKIITIGVLIVILIPMIYNIFLADTAAVVKGIETTNMSDSLSIVKSSLLGAVNQHYIGLIGFTLATLLQLSYALKSSSD